MVFCSSSAAVGFSQLSTAAGGSGTAGAGTATTGGSSPTGISGMFLFSVDLCFFFLFSPHQVQVLLR